MSDDILRDLVEGERAALVPAAGSKKKTWKRVATSVAVGGPVPVDPAGTGIASKLSLPWVKGLIVAVLGGAVAVGGYQLAGQRDRAPARAEAEAGAPPARADPDPEPAAPSTPMVAEGAAPAPTRPPAPAPVQEASSGGAPTTAASVTERAAKRRASKTPTRSAANPASSTLAEETRLLARARGKLERADPNGALAVLREHARRFPRGQLTEDRMALVARATCRAGDLQRGRREADALRRAFPSSSHLPRVQRACDDA